MKNHRVVSCALSVSVAAMCAVAGLSSAQVGDATVTARPGVTTSPATYPTLADLPAGLDERVDSMVALRRDLRVDLARFRTESNRRFRELVPSWHVLRSPGSRELVAKDVVPLIRSVVQVDFAMTRIGTMGESRDTDLYGAIFSPRDVSMYNAAILKACGDDQGADTMVKFYGWPAESVSLAAAFLVADEATQGQLVEALGARLDAKNPADTAVVDATLIVLRRELISDESLSTTLLEKLRAAPLNGLGKNGLSRYESQLKMRAAMGQVDQPIELRGKLVGGEDFTSASLLGKVVVVDFWATWCGPCKAELPRIKALRDKYRERGFEVLGISNDIERANLVAYLKENPDISWPQLFEQPPAGEGGFHPIARRFGINAIPALYIIDRKGVLRSTDARKDLEAWVEKLIAEE